VRGVQEAEDELESCQIELEVLGDERDALKAQLKETTLCLEATERQKDNWQGDWAIAFEAAERYKVALDTARVDYAALLSKYMASQVLLGDTLLAIRTLLDKAAQFTSKPAAANLLIHGLQKLLESTEAPQEANGPTASG